MNNREELLKRKKELEEELSSLNKELCNDPEFKEQIVKLITDLGFVKCEEFISDENTIYEMLSDDSSVLCTLEADFREEVFDFCYSDYNTGIDIKQDVIRVREELLKYLETPISFINYEITTIETDQEWVLQEEYKDVLKLKDSSEDFHILNTVTLFSK